MFAGMISNLRNTLEALLSCTPLLTGDTVKLVPLALEHLDGLCAVGLDPAIWALTTARITTRDEMRDFVETALRDQQAGHTVPFATMLREADQIVGSTRFLNIVPEHRRAEIGWTWIAPPWQRTRVNTEAKYLMLRHAFETWKLRRVEFKTSSLNHRSRAALLRIGATEEGTFRAHMVQPDGSRRDSVYFSIIAEEWPDVRAQLGSLLRSA